jgi:hypothetical protein
MIADAWHLVHDDSAVDRREAYELQALAYRVVSEMLDRLGETHLPWTPPNGRWQQRKRPAIHYSSQAERGGWP